ncbi:hypothetical protein KW807_00880 [Candidatus Parcubacteria bacterium]|nr:hypothetical protein [Candidatus Parcubacteria bacterium]
MTMKDFLNKKYLLSSLIFFAFIIFPQTLVKADGVFTDRIPPDFDAVHFFLESGVDYSNIYPLTFQRGAQNNIRFFGSIPSAYFDSTCSSDPDYGDRLHGYQNDPFGSNINVSINTGFSGGSIVYDKNLVEGSDYNRANNEEAKNVTCADGNPGHQFERLEYFMDASLPISSLPAGDYHIHINEMWDGRLNFRIVDAQATINVTSNMTTHWTITGPNNFSGSGTFSSYSGGPGSYSIVADSIACYTKSFSPSSNQNVTNGNTITFNIIYTDDGTCGPPPPPPPPPPGTPIADIKANGSDSSISIASGASATISWTSTNVTSCSVTPTGWTGTSGSQSTGALSASVTYTLNCNGPDGAASDSIYVGVGEAPPPPGCDDCSEYISQVVPTTVYAGQVFPASITMRNMGSNTWTCCTYGSDINTNVGYKLGLMYEDAWNMWRVAVPSNIPTGASATFNYNVTAPSTPGTYYFQWRMVSEFVHWFGDASPQTPINVVAPYTLTTTLLAGDGDITGSGINCISGAGDCSQQYAPGTSVTLTGTSKGVYAFSYWVLGAVNDPAHRLVTNPYTFTMDSNKLIQGVFNPGSATLTTSIAGGSGTITAPGGISCPGTCSATFTQGVGVSVIATPAAGQIFVGWTGACAGQSSGCSLTLDTSKNTAATFAVSGFDYGLANSGSSNVTKTSGNAFTQNNITKVYNSGTNQLVTISLSGVPSGTSYSISNNPCYPGCVSVITFTVSPSTTAGTYPITVTGSPLGKTTTFNLIVANPPMSVSCAASPATVLVGQPVTWTATVTGGTAPYTYSWSGTNIPVSPAPTTNPYVKTYSTVGTKTATVTVNDSDALSASCPGGAGGSSVQVNFNPHLEEF